MLNTLMRLPARVVNEGKLLRRCRIPGLLSNSLRAKNTLNEEDCYKPIKYSTSEAGKWLASTTFQPRKSYQPAYTPPVVLGSIVVLLIYFCFIHEHNDIDEMLDRDLTFYLDVEAIENIGKQKKEERIKEQKVYEQLKREYYERKLYK